MSLVIEDGRVTRAVRGVVIQRAQRSDGVWLFNWEGHDHKMILNMWVGFHARHIVWDLGWDAETVSALLAAYSLRST